MVKSSERIRGQSKSRNGHSFQLMNTTLKSFSRKENIITGEESKKNILKKRCLNKHMIKEIAKAHDGSKVYLISK